ncbi:MAG: PAS domain S-box protein [Anaerolineaceae bacterium]|nr:PAS domain S-box protein [Anaerolineaceae bacterium]
MLISSSLATIYHHLDISMIVLAVHADGEIVFVGSNSHHQQLLGRGTQPNEGQTLDELSRDMPEVFMDEMIARLRSCVQSGEKDIFDLFHVLRGQEYWCRYTIIPVRNDQGRVEQVIIHATDQSEAHGAQEALEKDLSARHAELVQERTYLSKILNTVQNGIILVDVNTKQITDCNQAALKISGYTRENLIGQVCTESICASCEFCPLIKSGSEIQNVERSIIDVNGLEVPVMKSLSLFEMDGREYILESFYDLSDIKRAEGNYQSIYNQSVIGIAFISAQGEFVSFNNQFCRMLGYSAEELRGKTYLSLTHPEDRERSRLFFTRSVEEQFAPYAIEKRYLRKDGSTLWVHANVTGAGQRTSDEATLVVLFEDITAQKEAEARLAQQRQELDVWFQSMPIAYAIHEMIFDADGNPLDYRFLNANPFFEQITGLKMEAVLGKTIKEINPNVNPKWIKLYGEVVKTHQSTHFEDYLPLIDRYVDCSVFSPREGQFAVAFTDITEQRRNLQIIQEKEQQLSMATESTGIGVWEWTPEKLKFFENKIWKELFGFEDHHKELDPAGWYLLFDYEDAVQLNIQILRHIGRKTDHFEFECRYPGSDGQPGWIKIQGKVLKTTLKREPLHILGIAEEITHQKQAEGALREQEEKLHEAVDLAKVSYWDLDVNTMEIIINPDLAHNFYNTNRMVSPDARVPLETILTRYYTAEDRERLAEGVKRAIHTTQQDFHLQIQTGAFREDDSGQLTIPIELMHTIRSRRDEYGNLARVYGTLQDITEMRAMERALREREAQYRNIFEKAGVGITRVGLDGSWIDVNPKMCQILGYEKKEIIGKTFLDFTHPKDMAFSREKADELIEGKIQSYAIQKRYLHKNGSTIWVSLTVSMVRDESGNPHHMISVVEDITERKRIERALQLSEENFRGLVHNTPGVIYRCLPDEFWTMTYVSGAIESLTGYPASDFFLNKNRSFSSLIHEEDQAFVHDYIFDMLKSETSFTLEYRIVHKDGSIRWVRENGQGIFDEHGKLTSLIGYIGDISDRKKAEAELIEARIAAEEANRAKSDFLANVSHEIRTPMNAITGLTYLAMESGLPPRQQNYLRKINKSANNLLNIVNDILDFSKIEARKMDIERVPFDLDDILDQVGTLINIRAKEKNIHILFAIDADVPQYLIGDPIRLEQILLNLGNNAVKFTNEGSVVFSASVLSQKDGLYQIQFAVSDTGIGMTEEQIQRVFDAFSQADTSTTRKYGGTGLGLTISQQLVELMGGKIWAESTPGTGSTFKFVLDLELCSEFEHNSPARLMELSEMRVLVVDPHRESREFITRQIESFSVGAAAAESGAEALALLRSQSARYQMVVMDWSLPDGNGIEFARQIQADPAFGGMTIIFMVSAYDEEEARTQISSFNTITYAVKPISRSAMYNLILESLLMQPQQPGKNETQLLRQIQQINSIHPVQLLLVEDNELNQEVAREMLMMAGFHLDIVSNGVQALERLAARRYDLVLMDIQMPQMDGYETTRRVRALDSANRDVPIIAMTANAMSSDYDESLKAGMNAHVGKPIHPQTLFMTIMKHIPLRDEVLQPVAAIIETAADQVEPGEDEQGLAGIDYAEGVERMNGNESFYRRMLKKLIVEIDQTLEETRRAMESNEVESAIMSAHSLRGVAANLSALRLAEIAKTFEAALKAGQSDAVRAGYEQFCSVCAETRERLIQFFDEE